jgi:hypothetical protein
MIVLAGFAVGYWIGTQHGRKGLQDLIDACNQIQRSDEFRALVSEGARMAEQVVRGVIAGRAGNGTMLAALTQQARELLAGSARLRLVR